MFQNPVYHVHIQAFAHAVRQKVILFFLIRLPVCQAAGSIRQPLPFIQCLYQTLRRLSTVKDAVQLAAVYIGAVCSSIHALLPAILQKQKRFLPCFRASHVNLIPFRGHAA